LDELILDGNDCKDRSHIGAVHAMICEKRIGGRSRPYL
jgi:hypothetical protein